MNIVFIAPECYPYTSTSALSYFVYGLSKGIEKEGNNVKVIIPRYGSIDPASFLIERLPAECKFDFQRKKTTAITYKGILSDSLVSTFLIDNQSYFSNSKTVYFNNDEDYRRFEYFCNGVLSVLNSLKIMPDIIHLVGPHMSYCASLIKEVFEYRKYNDAKIIFSFSHGKNLLSYLTGTIKDLLVDSSAVTVFSKFHALEIQKDAKYFEINSLINKQSCFTGILCEIDEFLYNPESDVTIAQNYSKSYFSAGKKKCKESIIEELGFDDINTPLFALVPQIDSKQDEDFLIEVLTKSLNLNLQMIMLHKKEDHLSNRFIEVAKQFYNLRIVYEPEMENKVFAGADFLIYLKTEDPSIIQLQVAMKYGAIPIVRKDSAAQDIVISIDYQGVDSNGFYLDKLTKDALLATLKKAIDLYRNREKWPGVVKNAMGFDSSITPCAKKYMDLYKNALSSNNKLSLVIQD